MFFKDIIGQSAAKAHVLAAIARGRLPHALMLRGPAGTGKLAMATAIAQYINCLNPTEEDSCGKCSNCIKIAKGIHADMHFVLPIISKKEKGKQWLTEDYFEEFRPHFFEDPYFSFEQWQQTLGGENKQLMISVHEIRALKRKVFLKAFEGKYKVIVLWQAERVRTEAANAFLKLLEEPPDKTIIIMTCSDPSQLLTTINSRCQQVSMGRLDKAEIQAYLQQSKGLEADRAESLAAIAEGSIGQALAYIDEEKMAMNTLYAGWLRMVYTGHYGRIQKEIEPISRESKEFQKLFLIFAAKKMRDSLLFHLGLEQLSLATTAEREFQSKFSQLINAEKVEKMVALMDDSYRQIAGNANAPMVFAALSLRLHAVLRG